VSGAAHRSWRGPTDVIAVATPTPYVGLVTRVLAFTVDAALINLMAIVTAAAASLILSVVTIPDSLTALAVAAGGAAYVLWTIGYFVTFWTTTGQTPGDRLLRIRVRADDGAALRPRRALLRFVALLLAALPLFLGLLTILVDERRRGVHDMVARTVVVEAPRDPR
jgi:uncharacterized RDD family membrane protein YckC